MAQGSSHQVSVVLYDTLAEVQTTVVVDQKLVQNTHVACRDKLFTSPLLPMDCFAATKLPNDAHWQHAQRC